MFDRSVTRRKWLVGAGVAATGVAAAGFWWSRRSRIPLGMTLTEEEIEAGRALLTRVVSVDTHAHPGRFFVNGGERLSPSLKLYSALGSAEEATIDDMIEGGLSAASFAVVSDFQLLALGDAGLLAAREFDPGEAWRSYEIQMGYLQQLLASEPLVAVRTPQELVAAKRSGSIGAWFTAEGGDFLEGSLEHLDQAYSDGVRSITLVHYHTNEIGDIQTAAPVHQGLTPYGRRLIRAMNRTGMLIDLAHAAKQTAIGAIEASDKPVMISHSAIRSAAFDHPRFIDLALAKAVAQGGGILGAWPAGIGLATLADYVDQILKTIDLIGIDHVALGTDMDANYKPVFESYRQLPLLTAGLLKRGLTELEVEKFLGGNFLRVYREVAPEEEVKGS